MERAVEKLQRADNGRIRREQVKTTKSRRIKKAREAEPSLQKAGVGR